MKVLDLGFNHITMLEIKYFSCLPELNLIVMKHNLISQITESTFKTLPKLMSLDLSENKLNSLQKLTFTGLQNLILLNLLKNDINHVNSRLFSGTEVKLIMTDDFHVCCMITDPKANCTTKPLWPLSCKSLLSNMELKVVCWCIGILVISLNVVSIYKILTTWYKSSEIKEYDRCIILINFCDLLVGLCLITIAVKDIASAKSYVEPDILW